MNDELLQRFFRYVSHRQLIWRQRHVLGLPRPWTSDSVLNKHHFTNVYRELDPGTQYVHTATDGLKSRDVLFFTVAYRLINRLSTFTEFPERVTLDTHERWLSYLNDRFRQRIPVVTSRHLTPSRQAYRLALSGARQLHVPSNPTKALQVIRTLPGVGVFFTWQIHCDLVMLEEVDFDPDLVVVGDGAAFALAVLRGEAKFTEYAHTRSARRRVSPGYVAQTRCAAQVRQIRDVQERYLDESFHRWNDRWLDVKNIEHALCEWLRYEKLVLQSTSC